MRSSIGKQPGLGYASNRSKELSEQGGIDITNKDLITDLESQLSRSPVGDATRPSSIVSDLDAFLYSLNRSPSANVSAADIYTQRFPVTQQGYSGQTFTMPTYAAQGVVFPFHIWSKRAEARRQQLEAERKEQIIFDQEITQLTDEIHNKIFIEKRHQSYMDKIAEIREGLGYGASTKDAIRYMKANGIDRLMNMQWNNLASIHNRTMENYLKVATDTDAMGRSRYDPETKKLAAEFKLFIDNPEHFDPAKIDQYAKFYNKFNERVPLIDLAREVAKDFEDILPEDIDNAADIAVKYHIGDEFTNEQEQLFREGLKFYIKSGYKEAATKHGYDIELQNLKDKAAKERSLLEHEQELEKEEKKHEYRMIEKEAEEKEKPGKKGTVSDQTIPVTDPYSGKKLNIDAKDVITFPELKQFMEKSQEWVSLVPGQKVYVEDYGWLDISESIDTKPLYQFKANVNTDLEGKDMVKGISSLTVSPAGDYFTPTAGEGVSEKEYVLTEINAAGRVMEPLTEGSPISRTQQDYVTAIDQSGNRVELRGRHTAYIPKKNIGSKLTSIFGDYEKDWKTKKEEGEEPEEVKQEPEEEIKITPEKKEFISVSKLNAERGTKYTKEDLEKMLGDRYEIRD